MKKALLTVILALSTTVAFAATEKSSTENLSSITEKTKSDSNKIILTTDGPQLVKKVDAKKKKKGAAILTSQNKLEDDDFKRLEQELDSLSK